LAKVHAGVARFSAARLIFEIPRRDTAAIILVRARFDC
jgi:hypothetical protein